MGFSVRFKCFCLVLLIFIGRNLGAQGFEKISFSQESLYRKSAETIINNYYSTLSVIQDAEGSDKDEIIMNAVNSSFEDENVMVCNDLDLTKKTEKYKKIEDYLRSFDLLFSRSTVVYSLYHLEISKIFYSEREKFLFVKGEAKRVITITYNDTLNSEPLEKSDTTILDVYVKFGRGKIGHKIFSIKEHEDNLAEFKLVTIDSGQFSEFPESDTTKNFQPDHLSIKPGQFFLNSIPQGARVEFPDYPDFDFPRKETPVTLIYPALTYKIRLTKDNYDTIVDYISFADKSRSFKLVPNFSVIKFDVFPENSELYINGVKLNESFINSLEKKVPKGKVVVEITADHFHMKRIEILALPGFEYTIKETLRPKNGLLTLRPRNSGADGASIFIDNIPKGNLPFSDSLIEGRHTVRVTKKGYRSYIKSINLDENKLAELDISLFSDVKVKIKTYPSSAQLSIDGKSMGFTDIFVSLSVGFHDVVLFKDGFESKSERIEVHEDDKGKEFSFLLSQKDYIVNISSSPSYSRVFVDRENLGYTPISIRRPMGTHRVVLMKEGFFSRKFKAKVGYDIISYSKNLMPKKQYHLNLVGGVNTLGAEVGANLSHLSLACDFFFIPDNNIYFHEVSQKDVYIKFDPNYMSSHVSRNSIPDTMAFGISLKCGLVLPDPFLIRVYAGYGFRRFLYRDIYLVTNDAIAFSPTSTYLKKGSYYYGSDVNHEYIHSLVIGLQVPVRRINIGADYWTRSENGSFFVFHLGYNFY